MKRVVFSFFDYSYGKFAKKKKNIKTQLSQWLAYRKPKFMQTQK